MLSRAPLYSARLLQYLKIYRDVIHAELFVGLFWV